MRGSRALGPEAELSDPFSIYLLLDNIYDDTKHLWPRESNSKDFSTMNNFIRYLTKRCDALECTINNKEIFITVIINATLNCVTNSTKVFTKCNQYHFFHDYLKFKTLSMNKRHKLVSEKSKTGSSLQFLINPTINDPQSPVGMKQEFKTHHVYDAITNNSLENSRDRFQDFSWLS